MSLYNPLILGQYWIATILQIMHIKTRNIKSIHIKVTTSNTSHPFYTFAKFKSTSEGKTKGRVPHKPRSLH